MDLAEYTRNSDRNKFWELPSGVAQNLLDEAIDRIADLEAQLAAAQERNTALQSEHLDRVIALYDQLTAMTAERDLNARALFDVTFRLEKLKSMLAAANAEIERLSRYVGPDCPESPFIAKEKMNNWEPSDGCPVCGGQLNSENGLYDCKLCDKTFTGDGSEVI